MDIKLPEYLHRFEKRTSADDRLFFFLDGSKLLFVSPNITLVVKKMEILTVRASVPEMRFLSYKKLYG